MIMYINYFWLSMQVARTERVVNSITKWGKDPITHKGSAAILVPFSENHPPNKRMFARLASLFVCGPTPPKFL